MNKSFDSLLNTNDPFTTSTLISYNNFIYSIGPDKIDNYALIVYDPTNGIISRGDILVKTR